MPERRPHSLPRMTLLGAMKVGNRYFLGAGGLTLLDADEGNNVSVKAEANKVFRMERLHKVVWGFTGSVGTGYAFRDWFQEQHFSSWDTLTDAAGDRLAQENGRTRALAQTAGAAMQPTDVLMCGFVNNEGRVIHLFEDGRAKQEDDDTAPVFAGAGMAYAIVAWNALVQVQTNKKMYTLDTFRLIMETVAKSINLCGMPVTIEEADAEGSARA